jgi:hypothetical protein
MTHRLNKHATTIQNASQATYQKTVERELKTMNYEMPYMNRSIQLCSDLNYTDAIFLAPTIIFAYCATNLLRHVGRAWPTLWPAIKKHHRRITHTTHSVAERKSQKHQGTINDIYVIPIEENHCRNYELPENAPDSRETPRKTPK